MDERDVNRSKEHDEARRKMRRFLLRAETENADEIVDAYYRAITLAEHEAGRRARSK